MRWLLILLIAFLAATDILSKDMSMGHGLSVKNALLYLIALGLFFRVALSGEFRMRLPIIHAAFAVWIGYAILTWVVCSLIIQYSGYDPIQSGIALKSELVDSAIFYFTVFYGVREERDFRSLWKALAAALCVANVATITDVVGITDFGVRMGTSGAEADRVFGVFGHANDTGALIVCLLPLVVATGMAARGPTRVLWYTGVAISLAVLILTVSRGAFVGVVVGYAWAAWLCRRFLPLSRVGGWVLMAVTAVVLVIAVTGLFVPYVADVVGSRLLGQSTSIDIGEVSSGRTNIWANAVSHMLAQPITLLTGFGWYVYDTMFVYATHNYYLNLWFNLGLVAVGAFLGLLYQAVSTARRAALATSDPQMRREMIAFIFGTLALAVSLVFANLTKPWAYIWIYFGVTLRAAVDVLEHRKGRAPVPGTDPAKPAVVPFRLTHR
jgi:hypothetical protein